MNGMGVRVQHGLKAKIAIATIVTYLIGIWVRANKRYSQASAIIHTPGRNLAIPTRITRKLQRPQMRRVEYVQRQQQQQKP